MDLTKIGNGVFMADLPAGSPEWLELRRTGITGSDVASIMGVSKWVSAFALWAKKTGQIPDGSGDSEPMEWGRILEPVIRSEFVKRTGWDVIEVGTYRNESRPWQIANPDGIIDRPGGQAILEIKTAAYADDWTVPDANVIGTADMVPRYYRTQVQHYLDVFGFADAFVAVLFSGNKFRIYHVPADDFEQSTYRTECEKFLKLVADGIKPDWDGSASTYEAVRALHPAIDETERVDLGRVGFELADANRIFESAEKLYMAAKSAAMDKMGNAKTGFVKVEDREVVIATRQARGIGNPYLVVKGLK